MSDDKQSNTKSIFQFLHHPQIDDYIFISLIAASFIGELMMDISMLFGFFYWVTITPFFFIASILSEKAKHLRTGHEIKNLIQYEIFFWGSASVAVILVFFLWDTERIGPSEASIIIHIILAHTLFLTGVVLGFRFYLIGILLFITAILSITTDYSTGFSLDLVVISAIVWLGFRVKNQFILPIMKRESDFTKSDDAYPGKERRS